MEKASNLKQEMTKTIVVFQFEVLETSQLRAVKGGGNCSELVGDKRRRRTGV
jgi:hypothetical protein